MSPVFTPQDRPRRPRPAPGTPASFDETLRRINELVVRIRAGKLYPEVYELAYSTLAGRDVASTVNSSDSDVTGEAAVAERRRSHRRAARTAEEKATEALHQLQDMERALRYALGMRPARGRRPGWWSG